MGAQPLPGDMPYDEHDEDGQFKRMFSEEKILDAIHNGDGGRTTSEIAREVGCSNRLALKRLRELEEEGRVRGREVGNTFLWLNYEHEDE